MTFAEWWETLTEAEHRLLGKTNAAFVWLCATQAEREECAKVCEMTPCYFEENKRFAAAIRSRSADEREYRVKQVLGQERALQALHDENERLGLYKDAYGQPEPVIDHSAAVRIATALGWEPKREPQRTWQGLTDEQISGLRQQHGITSDGRGIKEWTQVVDFAKAIEAKLKEKNT